MFREGEPYEAQFTCKKILFMTVGGSPEPLATSLQKHGPDHVVFICSDDVDGAKGTHSMVPDIASHAGLAKERYTTVKLTRIDDLGDCYERMLDSMEEMQKRFPQANLIADYTGGTKTMSSALTLSSLDNGHVELMLVSGKRTTPIKVLSGTQRVIRCNWKPVAFKRKMDLLKSLFQAHDYTGCVQVVEDASLDVIPGSQEDKILQCYNDVCKGLGAWERFAHQEALDYLELYAKNYHGLIVFLKGILQGINVAKNGANELDRVVHFFPVHDLLLNASRCMDKKAYDDAVCRLYRAVELFAQMCLAWHKPPLLTRDVDTNNLPNQIQAKYLAMGREYQDKSGVKKVKVELALTNAYMLLRELGHPVGTYMFEQNEKQLKKMKQILSTRNLSFMAHGFEPIESEKALEFNQFAIDLVTYGERALKVKKDFSTAPLFPKELIIE